MKNSYEKYINRCFELAERGRGKVSPNPLVGSVILKNDQVIAEGWHTQFGKPHAEAEALKIAGANAKDATLFCNLEPCCHTNKKTPPCAQAIIRAGIKKVIISNVDPNPQVAGGGIKLMQDAGIEVVTGILENEGTELNKFFLHSIKEKKPYVMLKVAQTIDGKISLSEKEQTWITGSESTEFVHQLRSQYDAVLVGANTVNIDNPALTVREVEGRNPAKVIIDGRLNVNPEAQLFNGSEDTYLFCSKNVDKEKVKALDSKGVKIFQIDSENGTNLDLDKILKILANEKISSIMVEGGAGIFSQFIDKKLFNELIILQGAKLFGKGLSAFNLSEQSSLKLSDFDQLGNDLKIVYRKI